MSVSAGGRRVPVGIGTVAGIVAWLPGSLLAGVLYPTVFGAAGAGVAVLTTAEGGNSV